MTGKTSQRVMNLMSSMAATLLGSAMATVSVRHPVLPGQHLADLGFLDKTQLDQGIAEAHPGVFLLQKRLSQLFLGDQTLAEEDLTELVLGKGNARRTQLIEIEGLKCVSVPSRSRF